MKMRLTLVTLSVLFTAVSCSVPAGSHKASSVIAQRCDAGGKPAESIIEEKTISKEFYPLTPEGPFVTQASPSRIEYSIVAEGGSQQRLKFLTRADGQEPYLAFFPVSEGRWIGIAPAANGPVEQSLSVCVFNRDAMLFSTIVPACNRNEDAPLRAFEHPEALRSTFLFYAYDFDPKREVVTFTTRN